MVNVPRARSRVALNGSEKANVNQDDLDWPPSFTLDQERVLELLTGDRFYADPSAALREAILNAIDAIHRRRQVSVDLLPEILVTLDSEARTLTVADNGVGMDGADVGSLFAKVGASAATEELKKESVGEFGIGVVSYFMAGDTFQLETWNGTSGPIGLEFSRAMLAGGNAREFPAARRSQGTTVCIQLRDQATFDLLHEKFAYWCRDVEGLRGQVLPHGEELRQHGAEQHGEVAVAGLPNWIEGLHLRPVSNPTGWESMTDNSSIAVLYRGVFVQEFEAPNIWGIEGSIDVDPKYFKPRLNREGFVEAEFGPQVTAVLAQCHPAILEGMVRPLVAAIDGGVLERWSQRRWATLWLSIPRSAEYAEATRAWDEVFSAIPAFEIAGADGWEPASLQDIEGLRDDVYLAPLADERTSDVVRAAIRLLRNTAKSVVRGLRVDRNWMTGAHRSFGTTADLIANAFAERIPKLIPVSEVAEAILQKVGRVAPLYTGPPVVDVVKLGHESAPVLRLAGRLAINIDHEDGRQILEEALRENRGAASLLASTARHASDHLRQVATAVSAASAAPEVLSPIRRRFIRSKAS